jgi:nucleotide-binding universal stress UspA family protein
MTKILFPTDFSHIAENAYRYTLAMAEKLNAQVLTLHVYEKPYIPGIEKVPMTAQEIYESIKMEEFEEYRKSVGKLREMAEEAGFDQIDMEHLLKEGAAVPTICRIAKSEDVDFIVMGTKGSTGLREIFLGSITAEVMENAPCPVLGIPEEARLDEIDKIAVTTDYHEKDYALFDAILVMAELFKANVYCLHVDTSHTEKITKKMDGIADHYKDKDNFITVNIDNNDIEKGLVQYATEEKIDLIAMRTERRNFFQELFHYSIAKRMSYHTKIPILAVPERTL